MFPNSQLGLFDLLVAIVVFQYLFIGAFLIGHRPGKSTGNFHLAIFFCLIAVNLIDGELMRHGFYYRVPSLALLEDSLVLTYGPLLYFYTLSIVRRGHPRKRILHYVPAVLLLLIIISVYTMRDEQDQRQIMEAIVSQRLPVASALLSFGVIFGHFFIYLALCFKEIREYNRLLEDQYASLDDVNLSWLSFTLKILGVTFIISWMASFFSILQRDMISEICLIGIVAILLYYINTLLIKALKDPRLFAVAGITTSVKNARVALEPIETKDVRTKLDHAMTERRLYSQPDLTLEKLSEQTGVPSRKLSQFLNDVRKQSFFDYVNGFRIDEAQSILMNSKDPKLTVQEVMYQVGFNSKSSFNVLFKEKTGLTPSKFRKSGSSS